MTKQLKGLGKGLDAIFQNSGISPMGTPRTTHDSTVNELPLDKIKANPTQPRTIFNAEAIEELTQSIRRLGIIQPITVRENTDGTYLIISGERRFKAATMAGFTTIPAYVRKANDQELLEMALVENIQREELSAIEIALTLDRLLHDCNLTQEQLSERIGKKRSTISNYVRLLSLPAEVQAALQQSLISMGHARAIAALTADTDQLYILEQTIENALSVRETEELVAKMTLPKKQTVKKAPLPSSYKAISSALTEALENKVSITRNAKGEGRITIRFDDQAQLDKIKQHILNR